MKESSTHGVDRECRAGVRGDVVGARREPDRRTRTPGSSSWLSTTSTATSSRNDLHRPGRSRSAKRGTRNGRDREPVVPAGGAEYLATHVKELRTANTNTITVGSRRPDRREPAAVRPVPRRAGDRGAERGRHRRRRHRQPRVRRGPRRDLPDDERRLPSRRRLPGRHAVLLGSTSATSPRTSSSRAPTDTVLPPYEVRKVGNAKIAFIGMTLEGTPLS